MASLFWGTTSQFDEAIERATDAQRLLAGAEDIALNLEISDQIRSKSIPPKDAMRSLKKRLDQKNPNVQLLSLSLIDICIKNGGDHFLVEVASREFMDNLVSILKLPALNREVKEKILRLIQNCSISFEGKHQLAYVGEVYKTLKREGFDFPPQDLAATSSAMVDTQTAPEWIDSDVCLRCRTPFSFTNRKHHCRNCGQVFDQQCSSKVAPLPHFGITQEVRVCDPCYLKLNKTKKERRHSADDSSPKLKKPLDRSATTVRHSGYKSSREVADEDLQRAIQLSLQEAHATRGDPKHTSAALADTYSRSRAMASEPPLVKSTARAAEDDDPDLRAAIEASLREANAPRASAPVVEDEAPTPRNTYNAPLPVLQNYDLHPLESDAILTFNQTVDEVVGQGGVTSGDLTRRHPGVTELYDRATGLRPKLARSLDDTDRKEQMLAEMNDKLTQAVKLYDSLLTEQVSHRYANASQNRHSYSYSQPQYLPERVASPAQSSYLPPQQQQYPTYTQTVTAPPQTQQYIPPQSQPVTSPIQVSAPPLQRTNSSAVASSPTLARQQSSYRSSEAPQYQQPQQQYQSPPQQQQTYTVPEQQTYAAAPAPVAETYQPNQYSAPQQPQQTYASSPSQYQPPQVQRQPSYASPPAPAALEPAPVQTQSHPTQAISAPPPQSYNYPTSPGHQKSVQPQQHFLQYQKQPFEQVVSPPPNPQFAAAPTIPFFPSVPVAPLPTVAPAPEPKEAMLISFD